ncbi:Gfo/Idh/MocA family protein [Horticoccus sp. 23ND18S-11]|uniref:Gfo/Idh/MocA family protein n=1 Tax=Horticoccus sp. 23ND18S-11 TaxID=3391832 RepID=UPI0039C97680
MNRRHFLHTSAAATTLAALPFSVRAADKSGTRKFRTALIGCGWWGNNILREAMASGACEVVALCDVDARQFEPTLKNVSAGTGDTPKLFKDYRELLAQAKPDIAIIGTPDHWHALPMIAAVKAGAHVYVEKPIGHTVMEGRAMVNAARATGRVVQVGTHRRISPHNVSGRDFIRSGKIGEIGMVRCFVNYGGGAEKPLPTVEVPKELDWNLWCGPAPLRPFNGGDPRNPSQGAGNRGIHPRGFRNYLEYANGTLGDWGIHWLDQVLWITGEKYPKRIYSTGGRPIAGPAISTAAEQTTDAPDHQLATFSFDTFSVQWEHRRFAGNNTDKGENVGCYFYGTKGTFHMGWQKGWTFYPTDGRQPVVTEEPKLNSPDAQNIKELWADFLNAIRTGAKPVSDIGEVHLSTNMALLGMLSLKHGKSIEWDGAKERIIGDDAANTLLRREYRKGWEYPSA